MRTDHPNRRPFWARRPRDKVRATGPVGAFAGATFVAFVAALILTGCQVDEPGAGDATFPFLSEGFRADLLTSSVASARRVALAPDGRVFFVEQQTGRIGILDPGAGTAASTPFAIVNVTIEGEQGLIGLALSPSFATDGYVYVLATVNNPPRSQLIRFRDNGVGTGVNRTVLLDNLPSGQARLGGALAFDSEGHLLVALGDMERTGRAQDDQAGEGKLLRVTLDGAIPATNPDPNSALYARGLRDPRAIALDLAGVNAYVVDAASGREGGDRVVRVEGDANYGWGRSKIDRDSITEPVPVATFRPTVGPAGLVFHDGTSWGSEFAGNLFVVTSQSRELLRIVLAADASDPALAVEPFARLPKVGAGRPLGIVVLPTGDMLVSTTSAIWRVSTTP